LKYNKENKNASFTGIRKSIFLLVYFTLTQSTFSYKFGLIIIKIFIVNQFLHVLTYVCNILRWSAQWVPRSSIVETCFLVIEVTRRKVDARRFRSVIPLS